MKMFGKLRALRMTFDLEIFPRNVPIGIVLVLNTFPWQITNYCFNFVHLTRFQLASRKSSEASLLILIWYHFQFDLDTGQ